MDAASRTLSTRKETVSARMIGWERYRLVLYHEFIDMDGKRQRIEDPITAVEMIPLSGVTPEITYVVNKLISGLTHFVLEKVAQEGEEKRETNGRENQD